MLPEAGHGRWHIVATTLTFWQQRDNPVSELGPALSDGRWRNRLYWTEGGKPKALEGADTELPQVAGEPYPRFRWRGAGLLWLFASDWRFVELNDTFAVTWFARATFGVTPEGMDVYARDAAFDPAPVIARLTADPAFAHLGGWYRPYNSARTALGTSAIPIASTPAATGQPPIPG